MKNKLKPIIISWVASFFVMKWVLYGNIFEAMQNAADRGFVLAMCVLLTGLIMIVLELIRVNKE